MFYNTEAPGEIKFYLAKVLTISIILQDIIKVGENQQAFLEAVINAAMTFSIMTLEPMTLTVMPLSIITLSIMITT